MTKLRITSYIGRPRRRKRFSLLAAGAALCAGSLVGCGASHTGRPASSAGAPTLAPTTTVTTTPGHALMDATGDDLVAAVQTLAQDEDYLSEHPEDVAAVERVYLPTANVVPTVRAIQGNLVKAGDHYHADESYHVSDVHVVSQPDALNAQVELTTVQGVQKIDDASGKTVVTGVGWPARQERWYLHRDAVSTPWRIGEVGVNQ